MANIAVGHASGLPRPCPFRDTLIETFIQVLLRFSIRFLTAVWLVTGVVIDTGVTGSARPKKSADLTATQPSVPDVPYEPELDIEIDFPRGTRAPRPPRHARGYRGLSLAAVTLIMGRSHFMSLSPPWPSPLSSLPK